MERIDVGKEPRPTENAAMKRGNRMLTELRRCLRDGSPSLDTSVELTAIDRMTLIRLACEGDEGISLRTLSVMASAECLFNLEAKGHWTTAVRLLRLIDYFTPRQAELMIELVFRGRTAGRGDSTGSTSRARGGRT